MKRHCRRAWPPPGQGQQVSPAITRGSQYLAILVTLGEMPGS
jgi:hypothetical protein